MTHRITSSTLVIPLLPPAEKDSVPDQFRDKLRLGIKRSIEAFAAQNRALMPPEMGDRFAAGLTWESASSWKIEARPGADFEVQTVLVGPDENGEDKIYYDYRIEGDGLSSSIDPGDTPSRYDSLEYEGSWVEGEVMVTVTWPEGYLQTLIQGGIS